MPELPDLELFAKNLRRQILNKKITEVRVIRPKRVKHRPSDSYPEGHRICDVRRDGKQLRFELDGKREFLVHLMLSGFLFVVPTAEVEEVKYRTWEFRMGDTTFGLGDPGGLATTEFEPETMKAPDAFDKGFTRDYLLAAAQRKATVPIKLLLVDQDIVRGIGNAYSDEILYAAGVDPESTSGKIPEEKVSEIHQQVGKVLKWAMKELERATPDATGGEYRKFLKVHRSDLKETAKGEPIRTKDVGGKKTYYVESQRRFD